MGIILATVQVMLQDAHHVCRARIYGSSRIRENSGRLKSCDFSYLPKITARHHHVKPPSIIFSSNLAAPHSPATR